MVLGGLAVLGGIMRRRLRGIRIMAGVAVLLITSGALALYMRRDERSRGVVVGENATIRLSPFESAESLGSATSGRIVRILEAKDGFRYVRIPGAGLTGWMSDSDVKPVMLSHS